MILKIPEIKTPLTDVVLKTYKFIDKNGIYLNPLITDGQKVIMECILGRRSPTSEELKRIHIMAHTRYGKSISIAAATAVRASSKKEVWSIVAGDKDKAQIIMDYVIQFSINDPILKSNLMDDRVVKIEKMTQRKKRDHLTYVLGGEIRAFGAGKDGNTVMGQGSPNVIEDESALINDNTQSKIFRMLGDHTDNFYMKIGNPFANNHFKRAYLDNSYCHINIDYEQGLAEGRITESYLNEVRQNPNFNVLYENIFPDEEMIDKDGFLPLYTDNLISKAMVEEGSVKPWGAARDGCDPADSGRNESVIARRWMNLAKIIYKSVNVDNIQFATEIATRSQDSSESLVDKIGVGVGTFNLLSTQGATKHKTTGINAGMPVPKVVPKDEADQFENVRAYMFWKLKVWLEEGNKIVYDELLKKQLLAIKYTTMGNRRGRIQIISKKLLLKQGIDDLGRADTVSFTFYPELPSVGHLKPTGGVDSRGNSLGR